MVLTGRVSFKGTHGKPPNHEKVSTFNGLKYLEVVNNDFMEALATWTNANIKQVSVNYVFPYMPGSPLFPCNVDLILVVWMRDAVTEGVVRFTIPAPNPANLEERDGGTRLKKTEEQNFTNFINDYCENTFTFLRSKVVQSR